ncbi:MAG: ribulose-phosphate 3-epimerase [Paracoccaceae bacterium]|jgi:ribulose-phosphate 3-epimerase
MTTGPMTALKARTHGISLGVFAADLGALRASAQDAIGWGCDVLHFDVMDGVFVPQMIGGPGFVKALNTGAVLDVHLMIDHPERHVASYVAAGADAITVHAEAPGAAQAIATIRAAAAKAGRPVLAGLGLMPGTRLEDVADLLAMAPDMILVLSLDPRSTAAPDIAVACARITELRDHLGPDGPVLAFDGGVKLASIAEIAACQPDLIVSGSAVFKADDPEHAFRVMAGAMTD